MWYGAASINFCHMENLKPFFITRRSHRNFLDFKSLALQKENLRRKWRNGTLPGHRTNKTENDNRYKYLEYFSLKCVFLIFSRFRNETSEKLVWIIFVVFFSVFILFSLWLKARGLFQHVFGDALSMCHLKCAV